MEREVGVKRMDLTVWSERKGAWREDGDDDDGWEEMGKYPEREF